MESIENLEQRARQVVSILESRESYEQKLDGSLIGLKEATKILVDHNDRLELQLSEVRGDNDRLSGENQNLNNEVERLTEADKKTSAQLAQSKDETKKLSELLVAIASAVEKITTPATDDDRLSRVTDLTETMKANLEHTDGVSVAAESSDEASVAVKTSDEASVAVETSDEASVAVETSDSVKPDEADDVAGETFSNVASIESFNPRKQVLESKTPRRGRKWKAAL